MPVIAVENLKYRYPNTESLALDGLSFTVEKGEFIGIVGENGAGKSTLSQALIGLVPQFYKGAYGGRVLIEDLPAETTPISELCCKVGLVFQNPFNQLSGASEGAINLHSETAGEIRRVTFNGLALHQLSGPSDEQGCYDIRPPCNPASPTGMGLDNAYRVNPQTGRAWGVERYPGGLPAVYARGVDELTLIDLRIRRPVPLPAGWNTHAIVQDNADA